MYGFNNFLLKKKEGSASDPIVLFGLGIVGCIILEIFKQKKIKVDYIIDNHSKYRGKKIRDIEILTTEIPSALQTKKPLEYEELVSD